MKRKPESALARVAPSSFDDKMLLSRANDLLDLFKRAASLGYHLTLTPDQLQLVVDILERAFLEKDRK